MPEEEAGYGDHLLAEDSLDAHPLPLRVVADHLTLHPVGIKIEIN